jgi:hypothetical protein
VTPGRAFPSLSTTFPLSAPVSEPWAQRVEVSPMTSIAAIRTLSEFLVNFTSLVKLIFKEFSYPAFAGCPLPPSLNGTLYAILKEGLGRTTINLWFIFFLLLSPPIQDNGFSHKCCNIHANNINLLIY